MSMKRPYINKVEEFAITDTTETQTEVLDVRVAEGYSYQINYSDGSSLDVDVTVQGSNDRTNWADITEESVTITGASGTVLVDVFDHNYGFSRLKIAPQAGTGNLSVVTLARSRER